MARTRQIKPGFFLHTELAELEPICRLLFIGLWTVADREGRLKLNPKRITAELLPYESGGTTELLRCLRNLTLAGFLKVYQDENSDYIEIVNFKKHQHIHREEKPSELPSLADCQEVTDQEFIVKYRISTEEAPHNYGSSTEEAPNKNALKLIALSYDPLANSLPTSSTSNEVEAAPKIENLGEKTPEQMRAELAPLFGWNGQKKKEVCWFDYLSAGTEWLSKIYPGEPLETVKSNAGKIIKFTAKNAFGKQDTFHKSWPPVSAFVEFLNISIGEPKDGGGLLNGRRFPETSVLMIRNVNQVFTDGQQTHEYAHAAYQKAGLV